jgi:hypothetical protein
MREGDDFVDSRRLTTRRNRAVVEGRSIEQLVAALVDTGEVDGVLRPRGSERLHAKRLADVLRAIERRDDAEAFLSLRVLRCARCPTPDVATPGAL